MGTNVAVINGRLASDPDVRTVGDTQVANFRLINNRVYFSQKEKREDVYAFDFEAWDGRAKSISMLKKGDEATVTGYAKQNTWEDKDSGEKRSKIVFVVNDVDFGRKSSKNSQDNSGDQGEQQDSSQENSEEIPF